MALHAPWILGVATALTCQWLVSSLVFWHYRKSYIIKPRAPKLVMLAGFFMWLYVIEIAFRVAWRQTFPKIISPFTILPLFFLIVTCYAIRIFRLYFQWQTTENRVVASAITNLTEDSKASAYSLASHNDDEDATTVGTRSLSPSLAPMQSPPMQHNTLLSSPTLHHTATAAGAPTDLTLVRVMSMTLLSPPKKPSLSRKASSHNRSQQQAAKQASTTHEEIARISLRLRRFRMFSSQRFVVRVCSAALFVSLLVAAAVTVLNRDNPGNAVKNMTIQIATGIVALFIIFCVAASWFLRRLSDGLHMKTELRGTAVGCVLTFVFFFYFRSDVSGLPEVILMANCSSCFFWSLALPAFFARRDLLRKKRRVRRRTGRRGAQSLYVHPERQNTVTKLTLRQQLDLVIGDTKGFKALSAFCQKEFSVENCMFVEAVQTMRLIARGLSFSMLMEAGQQLSETQLMHANLVRNKLISIHERFIEKQSVHCINLPSDVRAQTSQFFHTLSQTNDFAGFLQQGGAHSDRFRTQFFNLTVFDAAFDDIMHLLSSDTLPRFVRSSCFDEISHLKISANITGLS